MQKTEISEISLILHIKLMKKCITGILSILYLAMACGVVVEWHYCMGKLAGVSFFASSHDTCGRCGMKAKKSGCCHDDVKVYKLADDHKLAPGYTKYTPETVIMPATVYSDYITAVQIAADHCNFSAHGPPPDTGPSRCIRHCLFRI